MKLKKGGKNLNYWTNVTIFLVFKSETDERIFFYIAFKKDRKKKRKCVSDLTERNKRRQGKKNRQKKTKIKKIN